MNSSCSLEFTLLHLVLLSQVVSSFFKEMKVLQGCRHARIVQYVGRAIVTEESTIHFYLIMEYMPQVQMYIQYSKLGDPWTYFVIIRGHWQTYLNERKNWTS